MPNAYEFPCGCISHPLAGTIRHCAGVPSRSLTGRVVSPDDSAQKAHEAAMKAPESKLRAYPVARILP